ncbi:MAG TPA: PQQ-binding-like beta-propeller repeat protein [Anaerolineae bacterium]|nr:PQQ-binding-like beta-propeller repeat protein [Anaerolineae bacterium]
MTSRRSWHTLFFLSIFLMVIIAGCSGGLATGNWVGLSAYESVVYVADGAGITAVDIKAQEALWSFPAESSQIEFYAAPVADEEKIIIGDFGAQGGFLSPGRTVSLYAIDNVQEKAVEPSLLWQNSTVLMDRVIASPLLLAEEQLVIVGTAANRIVAFDANNEGEMVWSYEIGHSVWAQPAYEDGLVYIAGMDKKLYALEAMTGELVWEKEFVGALPGHPVVLDGRIYVGSFDENLHVLDAKSGEELWTAEGMDWVWSAPAVGNDLIYFADIQGNVYAVDVVTGVQAWQTQVSGQVQANLSWVDGVLYVASTGNEETNEGLLLALDDTTGEILWEATPPASIHTSPVIVEDMLVVALEQEDDGDPLLIVYDRMRGTQMWQFVPAE